MNAIRFHEILKKDGELVVTGLPYRKGQHVELIVLPDSADKEPALALTAAQLLESGIIGLWKDRPALGDSAVYARQLRDQAQKRAR